MAEATRTGATLDEGQSRPPGGQFAQLTGYLREFLETEAGSAGLIVVAVLVALAWANSPWSDSYFDFWATDASIRVGSRTLSMDLYHWVNDGLMVVFFFVIGLELRHEISVGELRDRSRLIYPTLAGLAGMVVPALLYLAVDHSAETWKGWGVVIGTDTAFLLAGLTLTGKGVTSQLRIFLLTATIVDDIVAVTIIGLAYSDALHLVPLLWAGFFLVLIALLGQRHSWQNFMYVAAGFGAWLATIESGLHPSVVGMLAGLLVVSRVPRRDLVERAAALVHAFRQSPFPSLAYSAKRGLQEAVSANERFQQLLHPWVSYLIVPIFALANAGVDLRGGVLGDALASPVMWGIVLGLVLGKPIGMGIVLLGGPRLGLGALPRGVGQSKALGGAALSGLGFSVSLLIVNLAFDDPVVREEATIGVLLACVLSVATGWLTFRIAPRLLREEHEPPRTRLSDPVDPQRDHIRGPVDAPLTLVEYADFECPFCGLSTGILRDLQAMFGDDLRYVFRHLPLVDVHPHAQLAAEAAEAAGEQGRFWEMHDLLFRHQHELEWEDLMGYAGQLELDTEQFARALSDGRYTNRVQEDLLSAEASGALGTPTFFIGGRRHTGPYNAELLAQELRESRLRQREPA